MQTQGLVLGDAPSVLHRVVEASFQQAFDHAASGTEAENTAQDLVVNPIQALCRMGQTDVESADVIVMGPTCGGMDLDFTAGDELVLESIEYADSTTRG